MNNDISEIHSSAIVRPGDALILLTEVHMTPEQAEQYRAAIVARHPGVEVTILTGMRQAVVVRDEPRTGGQKTGQSLPEVEPTMPDAIVTEDGSPMSSGDTDLLEMLEIAAGRRDGWEYMPFKDHEGGLYGDALDEIKRLRTLITEWADAEDAYSVDDRPGWFGQCRDALRKAVGR